MTEAGDTTELVRSTRDYDDLRVRLERWLDGRCGPGAEPVVSALHVPERNGMSSETVMFDVELTEAGARRSLHCVGRLAPESSATPVFPAYDFDKQFRVMRLVAEHSAVPVPPARWYEDDPSVVGAPFFVMDRVEGEVPPDVMPYNFGDSWLYDADPVDQRRLQDAAVGVLADLHAIDGSDGKLAFLEHDRPEPTALRRHHGDLQSYYRWVAGHGGPVPVLERSFAWLDEHWPADDPADAVLSWGDARIGNMMFRDFLPVAVLDWEMVAIAPREVDLAWMVFLHQFFEDIAAQMDLPGMPDFLRTEDVATTYEQRTGYTPRHLPFYLMYAAVRHGVVMARVEQRRIAFGEVEAPPDPDQLVMHRGVLEQIMAGTYPPLVGLS